MKKYINTQELKKCQDKTSSLVLTVNIFICENIIIFQFSSY